MIWFWVLILVIVVFSIVMTWLTKSDDPRVFPR